MVFAHSTIKLPNTIEINNLKVYKQAVLQSPPCNKSVHTEMQLPEYFNALQSKQNEKIADVQ